MTQQQQRQRGWLGGDEKRWAALTLELVPNTNCFVSKKTGQYWFADEVQVDVCGPYDTLQEAQEAQMEYAKSL